MFFNRRSGNLICDRRIQHIAYMKKILVRIGIVVAILIVIALVALALSLDSIAKKGIETVGPMVTKVPVTIESAHISPISASGRLVKLFVGNPSGYKASSAIEVADIKLGVGVGSVFSDTIVINELNLKGAEITLEGSLNGNNLTTILNNVKGANKTTTEAPATKASAKKYIVKDFVLEGAKVHLDLTVPLVGNLNLTVPLPPLHLQDIGVAEGGVTAEELVQQIMKPLLASVTQTATDTITKMGGQVKDLGKSGAQSLGKAVKGIGDLFKKQ
jgi:hypothetical protein